MESREAAIGQVLGRLRRLVADPAAGGHSAPALLRLVSAALGYVAGEPSHVRAHPAPLETLRDQWSGAGPRLLPDPAMGAGVIVASEDGRVTVDATLAGWLAAREPEVRMLIVRVLEEA